MRTDGRGKAYFYAVVVNVLWGLSFIASKQALGSGGFQPFSLALTRFFITAILLFPVLKARAGKVTFPKKDFLRIVLSALTGTTLYFLFEYKGLERTSASIASLIIAAVPAFTLLFSALVYKKKYTPACYLGVAASLLGVYLVVRYGDNSEGSMLGNFLIIGACLSWVAYIELNSRLLKKYTSLELTFWQAVFGTATLIPCAAFEKTDWLKITPMGWIMALYLAILCSVLAYLLYAETVKRLEPFRTALFININPLAAVLGGVLLLGETITPMQILGGLIVLGSIFWVNRSVARAGEKKA